MSSDFELLNQAAKVLESRKRLALCTVIEKKGSGPRNVGAKMAVTEDGTSYGTIGGGDFERALIDECIKILSERSSPRKVVFNLSQSKKEGEVNVCMVCGGELGVFVDVLEPTPRLIIVGVGHVSVPLTTLASNLGYRVTVVDDERQLGDASQFKMADEYLSGDYAEVIGRLEMRQSDYAVVANGSPEYDYAALKAALSKSPAYVGLLGSKTKAAVLTERLKREGVDQTKLCLLHGPCGLDIGAETPQEIAVSVLAQIIELKRKRPSQ